MSFVSILVDPRLYASLVLATALMRVIYAVISRAVAPYPRLRALVESVAALLPDVVRATLQLAAVATGRPAPRLDLAPPDPEVITLRRRLEAAEARVAELAAAGAPAAPVGHVDETTRAGRETIAPGMHGMMVLLVAALAGCASTGTMPDGPGATIRKVQSWWDAVCGTGHSALDLAVRTVEAPGADAGPSPGAPRDASATAESDGDGDAGAP